TPASFCISAMSCILKPLNGLAELGVILQIKCVIAYIETMVSVVLLSSPIKLPISNSPTIIASVLSSAVGSGWKDESSNSRWKHTPNPTSGDRNTKLNHSI
ncbi:unnamed protein product, partial [Meganyctiphanes norvegica]